MGKGGKLYTIYKYILKVRAFKVVGSYVSTINFMKQSIRTYIFTYFQLFLLVSFSQFVFIFTICIPQCKTENIFKCRSKGTKLGIKNPVLLVSK